jgi:hypothetical protein
MHDEYVAILPVSLKTDEGKPTRAHCLFTTAQYQTYDRKQSNQHVVLKSTPIIVARQTWSK